MNEHDDDIEPEVDGNVEFEMEEFPILEDDEEAGDTDDEVDIDPDESEI